LVDAMGLLTKAQALASGLRIAAHRRFGLPRLPS
jgi:hypothetical protein